MIRLESLQYLQEIARTKSINKAAENLFLSKSSLSVAIKKLEAEIGVPLLERSVHGVTLTAAGNSVLRCSNEIFKSIDVMKEECRVQGNKETVTFFMESGLISSLFSSILIEFKKRFPNVYFSVYSTFYRDIFTEVQEKINNIGMCLLPQREVTKEKNQNLLLPSELEDCVYEKIGSFAMYAVCSKYSKHVPDNVTELTVQQYCELPQIELLDTWNQCWVESNFVTDGKYVLTTDNTNVYYQAILNDLGVGVLLNVNVSFGNSERKQLRFIPIRDTAKLELWMICNKKLASEESERYVKIIKELLKV